MSIDFSKTFGTPKAAAPAHKRDLPKANVWVNIGYATGDETYPFVSLPMGIALDTMEELPLKGNSEFREFTQARNDLLQQIKSGSVSIAPGEAMLMDIGGGLTLQIRRVSDEQVAAPIEGNRFARELNFMPSAS
jgi:hypothetical protein